MAISVSEIENATLQDTRALSHLFIASVLVYLCRVSKTELKSISFTTHFNDDSSYERNDTVLQVDFEKYIKCSDLISYIRDILPLSSHISMNHSALNVLIRDKEIFLEADEAKVACEFCFGVGEVNAVINRNFLYETICQEKANNHVVYILSLLSSSHEYTAKSIPLISSYETQLYETWNNTSFPLNTYLSLHRRFEKNVAKNPTKTVLSWNGKSISYSELNTMANRFANLFSSCDVKAMDRVALCVKRSFEYFAMVLAILKLGSTYVPIDMNYPLEKINYILTDSNCKLLVTEDNLRNSLQELQCGSPSKIFCVNEIRSKIKKHSCIFQSRNSNCENIAYIIYTSGSTGTPKGVMVTHKNIINYTDWFSAVFQFTIDSIIDFSSSIGFDLSVACTLTPLILGGGVAICDEHNKQDPVCYIEHLKSNNVSHIETTPNYFNHLLFYPEDLLSLNKLKWIMLGGDALVKEDVLRWYAIRPNDYIVNEYGPTECTVAMTSYVTNLQNLQNNRDTIPLGKPMFNTKVYILDKFNNLLPPEVPGELCVVGSCVSKGYTDAKKMANKFIKNPFDANKYAMMYKTGDLAYWSREGNIEYLGRLDDQVKIRGYRIELYEIEVCLSKHYQVEVCKVLAHKEHIAKEFLAAYIVTKDKSLDLKDIRSYLSKSLPAYMIPTDFVIIDKMPLTESGKVDVKKLKSIANEQPIAAEKNQLNTSLIGILMDIWRVALKVDFISIYDDFFELGGDSLLLMQVIIEIEKKLLIRLRVKNFFKNPTINSLANHIKEIREDGFSCLTESNNKIPSCVCLNTIKSHPALFLFPPLGKTALVYKEFAEYWKLKHSIYVLQDPGVEDLKVMYSSLEEMATYYIDKIKLIQPASPYLIAGASFGATLAVEIAHQLESRGERVEFVGLIDGWATYSDKLRDRDFFHAMQIDKLKDLSNAEQLIEIQFLREQLILDYQVPKLKSKLTLLKSQTILPLFDEIKLEKNGFDINCNVDLYYVPGDHYSVLEEPNVAVLSEKIQTLILDKT